MGLILEADAYLQMAADEDRHWWFRGRRMVVDSTIRRLRLRQSARILELGSGTGGNLEMLRRFGTVTAVEMNDVARAISASKAGPAPDIRPGALPNDLPFADETFDLVCLLDVLEHVEDDQATLLAMAGLMVPGSAGIITVPAFARLWGPHDEALHHKRRYDAKALRMKIQHTGLEIETFTYINMLLFPIAVVARIVDRIWPHGRPAGSSAPPYVVNEIFARLFGAERFLLGICNLPIGLSLMAVVRKPQQTDAAKSRTATEA